MLRFAFAIAVTFASVASAAETTRHVAARIPVQGAGRELAAERPAMRTRSPTPIAHGTMHAWHLQQTLPGAVVHDIAFANASIGYAAAELGQVWKTTDDGAHWTRIMNLGYPYYWYGVDAIGENDVIVSGFDNQAGSGIVRWSHDGGATWSDDIVLTTRGWSMRVRFFQGNGLVMDLVNFDAANGAHYTGDGGETAEDWMSLVVDPNGGWFGNQFSMVGQYVRASGITYCYSSNGGIFWGCGPSVDSVFDGPTFFVDYYHGWVGGGEISPNVDGWLHRTTDGGATWSDRTLESPWPIREILFVSPDVGWAAGGNMYSNVGGIYYSGDGGATWTLDLDSAGNEMDACANVGLTIWCAGYNAAFDGVVYRLDLGPDDIIFASGFD